MTNSGTRRRLDTELVRRGLAPSREAARALVERGAVLVAGAAADKPARLVGAGEPLLILDDTRPRYVSRGGDKLAASLRGFGLDVSGCRCLDAGASAGGFTDCLLQHGAAAVVAVDVGRGQLQPPVRGDPRVDARERTDIRSLRLADVGDEPFDVVVADLSFISLATVAPILVGGLVRAGGAIVALVKPQFEAGRAEASRGRGVIRRSEVRRAALDRVASALTSHGATIMGAMASPVLGPAGNAEFFLYARARTGTRASGPAEATVAAALDAAVREAPDAARSRPPEAPPGGAGAP